MPSNCVQSTRIVLFLSFKKSIVRFNIKHFGSCYKFFPLCSVLLFEHCSWGVEDYTKFEVSSGGLHQVWGENWRATPSVRWAVVDYTKCEVSSGGLHQVWGEQWRITPSLRWAVEDYTKCDVSSGGSPRLFLTCILLLYTTHINTYHILMQLTVTM